ncbi:MAG: hotdog fold thioesterase [Rubricoccaceae bacterium]
MPLRFDPDTPSLDRTLGITYDEISGERVVATMPVTPNHHQPLGYLHGGASVVLAESVASVGATAAALPEKVAFGLEINANHVRPMREGTLRATATPLHRGRTTHVWEVRIEDEAGRLVCVSRCTLALVAAHERA